MSASSHNSNSDSGAFSLIELVAVMAIVATMLSIALTASIDWGRGTAMRGAVMNLRAALVMARQCAVTHAESSTFAYGNSPRSDNGYFVVRRAAGGNISPTNYLPNGISFRATNANEIVFMADGSGGGPAEWPGDVRQIILWENARQALGLTSTVTVFRVTGHAGVRP